ncbi:SRPBCC family protein [Dactylosporangium sp. NBC_01737]|uniref:SRPBCC family protein n=1 Tax=Dactylosporangium sp. NBC_01737 TaxID=2975959 RepID=UPI002E149BA7|nr:SRPBCC family protein [Dactylosporangium sp. NBC_01737]
MFDPGPLAEVTYDQELDGRWTLRFTRDLRHPPERVWRALTDPSLLDQWAPFTASRDLGAPGGATLVMIDGDTRAPLDATVRVAEPPALLVYEWGPDLLRWELAPIDGGTRLTLRHTTGGRDLLGKVTAGWHLCVRVLELLLDGTPHGVIRGGDAKRFGFDELCDAYESRI